MKFIILPIYRLPTVLSVTKDGFKALWTWCFSPFFPCTSGAAPVTQPGPPEFITEDQSTEPFHVFITFFMVLPTPSLHIEMVTYCRPTSYTNNTILKHSTKLINLLSKGTGVRWLKKWFSPLEKNMKKSVLGDLFKLQSTRKKLENLNERVVVDQTHWCYAKLAVQNILSWECTI